MSEEKKQELMQKYNCKLETDEWGSQVIASKAIIEFQNPNWDEQQIQNEYDNRHTRGWNNLMGVMGFTPEDPQWRG